MGTILLTILATVGFIVVLLAILLLWNVYKMLAQSSMLYQQLMQEVLPASVDTLNNAIEVIEHKKSKLGLSIPSEESY